MKGYNLIENEDSSVLASLFDFPHWPASPHLKIRRPLPVSVFVFVTHIGFCNLKSCLAGSSIVFLMGKDLKSGLTY